MKRHASYSDEQATAILEAASEYREAVVEAYHASTERKGRLGPALKRQQAAYRAVEDKRTALLAIARYPQV